MHESACSQHGLIITYTDLLRDSTQACHFLHAVVVGISCIGLPIQQVRETLVFSCKW